MKIHFNKVYGLGIAFDVKNLLSDDFNKKRWYLNLKIYFINALINLNIPVSRWKDVLRNHE
jgi:hypothetical protein